MSSDFSHLISSSLDYEEPDPSLRKASALSATRRASSGPSYKNNSAQRSWTNWTGLKEIRRTSHQNNLGEYASPIIPKNPPSLGRAWRTGFSQNVPWLGLISLLLALLSSLTSAALLSLSNGISVSSWRVAPSVILAVLSSLSTACLAYSLARGLDISWWRHMLKAAPLADAHRYWDHATNLRGAITAGREMSLMSIAKLLVALAAILEGPFIQQASKITTKQVSQYLAINAAIAVHLPPGYTADVTGEFRIPTTPSTSFSQVFNDYTNRVPIDTGFEGCPGTCNVAVPGVGFKVSCAPDLTTAWTMDNYTGGNMKRQFYAKTTWQALSPDGDNYIVPNGSMELLDLTAGWAINTVEPLQFVERVCNLSLAVVEYPVNIVNKTVILNLPLGSDPKVLFDLPTATTAPGMGSTGSTTLGGFSLIGNVDGFGEAQGPFYSNVSMVANGALALFSLYGLNPFAWSHAINPNWDVNQFEGYVWRDPIPDTLAAYHEIMFRLGLNAAKNSTLVDPIVLGGRTYTSVRNVAGTYTFNENFYISSYRFLGGALAVVLLAVFSVLPTFRGWWRIGRKTTLSPLETAKAFGAPLLAEYNSNATAEDLSHNVKRQVVQYGTTQRDEGWDSWIKLQLAEYGTVHPPRSETAFQR